MTWGFGLGEKIKNSLAGTRYYGDLIRERYVQRLLKAGEGKVGCLDEAMRSYVDGDYAQAAAVLEGKFVKDGVRRWLAPYTKRFGIEPENPGERHLESRAFILKVADIRKQLPDFNERNYALVEESPRIDWRVVPSQVDDLDRDGEGDEPGWVRTLQPGEKTKLWCYYSPGGAAQPDFAPRADAAMNWDTGTMANIGWESEQAAYRFYYGQIEAFGKKSNGNEPDRLILAGLGTLKTSYHKMQDWGMDVLHIGNASGPRRASSVWEDGEPAAARPAPGGKGGR